MSSTAPIDLRVRPGPKRKLVESGPPVTDEACLWIQGKPTTDLEQPVSTKALIKLDALEESITVQVK